MVYVLAIVWLSKLAFFVKALVQLKKKKKKTEFRVAEVRAGYHTGESLTTRGEVGLWS